MASILIVFGSTGGNTELVTDKVADVLTSKGHKVVIKRAELTKQADFKNYKYVVLGSSTYGQGLLQEHMARFIFKDKPELKNKKCAVIGLGDNKYNVEYVVEAAKILETMIPKLGGEIILPALRINKTPVMQLEGTIKDWAIKLSKLLK